MSIITVFNHTISILQADLIAVNSHYLRRRSRFWVMGRGID
jgi:hypothetical protein